MDAACYHGAAAASACMSHMRMQVVAVAYCISSLLTFGNFLTAYDDRSNAIASQLRENFWGLFYATFVAPMLVAGCYAGAMVLMVSNRLTEEAFAYAFGALHGTVLWTAAAVLHAAIALHGYIDRAISWEQPPPLAETGAPVSARLRRVHVACITSMHYRCCSSAMPRGRHVRSLPALT